MEGSQNIRTFRWRHLYIVPLCRCRRNLHLFDLGYDRSVRSALFCNYIHLKLFDFQIFVFLLSVCTLCMICCGVWETVIGHTFQVYLARDSYIPERVEAAGTVIALMVFLSYIIILNTFVPISLYVWWVNYMVPNIRIDSCSFVSPCRICSAVGLNVKRLLFALQLQH